MPYTLALLYPRKSIRIIEADRHYIYIVFQAYHSIENNDSNYNVSHL
jgi:hypothetical protein